MTIPSISSAEISGGVVLLSTNLENPIPVEILIYGSDLENVSEVQLDSGEDYTWVVGNVSASPNTVVVTAFAFSSSQGSGELDIEIIGSTGPIFIETEFVLPLID